jgi:hypothetical protein
MTAHELARLLLAGPDLPVYAIATCMEGCTEEIKPEHVQQIEYEEYKKPKFFAVEIIPR